VTKIDHRSPDVAHRLRGADDAAPKGPAMKHGLENIRPVQPAPAVSGPAESHAAEYDALADLFLTDGAFAPVLARPVEAVAPPASSSRIGLRLADDAAPAGVRRGASRGDDRASARTAVRFEGVILGHLPVLAAAWVPQLARHLAEQGGHPIALLRLQGGQVWIDLVAPQGVPGERDARPILSLNAAIAAAVAQASLWLVRVDEPSEPDLFAMPELAAVTLLTGADDAAVVASYRTIKALCEGVLSAGDSDQGARPVLRLAVMGADDDRAGEAEQKLQRAATTFLGRGIEPAIRVGKIRPSSSRPLYRGEAVEGVARVLERIRAAASAGSGDSSDVIPQAAPALPMIEPARGQRAPVPRPRPVAEPRPAPSVRLASRLPGLVSLDATCPYADGVELASDAAGSLHLLAATNRVEGEGSTGEAVRSLLTAASWADAHAPLLAQACPTLRRSAEGPSPMLHLMTEDPRSARGLIDTGVRLHLLAAVDVDGRTGWVCRDLN